MGFFDKVRDNLFNVENNSHKNQLLKEQIDKEFKSINVLINQINKSYLNGKQAESIACIKSNSLTQFKLSSGNDMDKQDLQKVFENLKNNHNEIKQLYGYTFSELDRRKPLDARIKDIVNEKNEPKLEFTKSLDKIKLLDENLLEMANEHFIKAREISQTPPFSIQLETFTGHTDQHTKEVMDNTMKYIELFGEYGIDNNCYEGNFDPKLLYVAAALHDIGMGPNDVIINDFIENFKKQKMDLQSQGLDKLKYKEKLQNLENSLGFKLRKNHALNSGMEILKSKSEQLKMMGVNPEKTAFLVYLHSKSSSGTKDLSDINALENSVKNFKLKCEKAGIKFDGNFTKQDYKDISLMAGVLRVADANRDMNKLTDMLGNKPILTGEPVKDAENFIEEVENMELVLGDKKYSGSDPEKAFSIGIYTGEGKCKMDISKNKDNGNIEYTFNIKDGHKGQECAAFVIYERIGELKGPLMDNILQDGKLSIKIKCENKLDAEKITNKVNVLCENKAKENEISYIVYPKIIIPEKNRTINKDNFKLKNDLNKRSMER